MGRSYTPAEFAQTVEKIRAALPRLGSTDVMVAFQEKESRSFRRA